MAESLLMIASGVFGGAMILLGRLAFPRIAEALDKRQRMIEDSIEVAEKTKADAEGILEEYRERLKEARVQAEEIVTRANKAAQVHERESTEQARRKREELMEQARRDIEAETRRYLEQIRKEVANLTVVATEKVTRKSLTPDDHRKLIEEALQEVDFSTLSGEGNGGRS